MFSMYPYTRDWFPNFDTTPEGLEQNAHVKAHVITVMQTIQQFVDFSFEPETLTGLVEKIARVHLGKCVTTVDMEIFWKCFMRQMKRTMGSRFNSKRERAWAKFLTVHNKAYHRVEHDWMRDRLIPVRSPLMLNNLASSPTPATPSISGFWHLLTKGRSGSSRSGLLSRPDYMSLYKPKNTEV
ncbi:globin [Elysia marginata]|uniref:Globin n=1 Tax=Elysia marginata TaxID=1093978 RepID=A0AAV4FW28_9GAST|nr:globin [Elysia marginata]